ncbi:sugar transporter ERD6-like 16 [Ananas comosus]|uniref:Sugar transporter ERD6-like 16 n=1 Tax=Ananas comosus TaxID=4615 RepID=A0A6P5ESZ5_ANACO|nr:sugar transporter ERD6-like 16 [Ananas comosus]
MGSMGDVERGIKVEARKEREVIREPLIQQNSKEVGSSDGETNSNSSCKSAHQDSIWMVLLSTAVAVCGSFEFGSCVGYSAPTQSGIIRDIGLSLSEYSIFGSILTIGAMIGAVTSGRIADFIGRKKAMRIAALICIVGWLAIYFAKGALMLYFGRLSSGYGIGVLSYVVPIFIAEIAPKNLRGGLATLNQLLICTGASVSFIVGTLVTWRTLVSIGVVPCIVLLVGLFFIPESPRWLAKVGQQKEFQVALRKLRGKNADITEEATEIQEYIESLQNLPQANLLQLFQSQHIRAVIVGVGLMVFQQLGGVNGVGFYASQIFVSAGFSSGNLGTILMGCIQVPVTMLGAILMDRSGRRPLLMISATGTFAGTFLTGLSFYLKGQGVCAEWVPTLALSGILVYMGAFSIGMGAVPWVIMSEIFSINIKAIGGSLVTLVNWFGSFAISYAFNFLMTWSSAGTFFLFSAVSAVTVLFVARVVPETKGKTLEEIQASLSSHR